MAAAVRVRIARERGRLSEAAAALDALSPLSTLARGYAVPLRRDGRLMRAVADFELARDFRLRVVDGYVPCAVTGRPRQAATAADRESTETGDGRAG